MLFGPRENTGRSVISRLRRDRSRAVSPARLWGTKLLYINVHENCHRRREREAIDATTKALLLLSVQVRQISFTLLAVVVCNLFKQHHHREKDRLFVVCSSSCSFKHLVISRKLLLRQMRESQSLAFSSPAFSSGGFRDRIRRSRQMTPIAGG